MSEYFLTSVLEHTLVETEVESELEIPKRYQVLLHNDDYTPMGFVVRVLKRFFFLDEATATTLMLQVHTTGKVICGVFTRDVAETKVVLVNDFARQHEYPLLCSMEQA